MKKILKIGLTVVGLVVLVVVIVFFLLMKVTCGTDTVRGYISPSGKQKIEHTILNCGATTDFTTSLDLVGILNKKIIVIKSAHEDDLSLRWVDDKHIIVNYTGDTALIYEYNKEISGIKIEYKKGDNELKVNCLYYECEEQSRVLEVKRRKEWCNYSVENRKYCDKMPGWETCSDFSWCHYFGPSH